MKTTTNHHTKLRHFTSSAVLGLSAVAILLSLLNSKAHAAAGSVFGTFDLPGTDYVTQWTNLSNTNPTRTPDFGTGTITPGSPGYQAGAGFYSFTGHYSFTISKTDFALGMDIENVILQIDWSPNTEYAVPYNGGPTLSYNGGSQNLIFDYSGITGVEEDRATSFGNLDFVGWAFQWDLSSIGADIDSITITAPVGVHTSVMAAQFAASENFVQAVPEPSVAALLGGAGLMALLRRRRHAIAS